MDRSQRRLDLVLNIAIIAVSVLLALSLIKGGYFQTTAAKTNHPGNGVGKRVPLQGVDWSRSEQTLLLMLRTDCIFCQKSLPFYQSLSQRLTDRGKVRMIAVFPQEIEKSKEYLESAGIAVDDIKQARLTELGIKGTPTLVLVDKDGIATDGWVGTLSASQQAEISKAVGAKSLWDE